MSEELTAPADVAAAPAAAEVTDSGLASIVLQEGSGDEKPSSRDTVEVHYSGWQSSDGMLFDSSVQRDEKISFPLNQVIPGWTEGLQLMAVGEKRRFWIPAELAYGETASQPGAPSGALVFDVELFSIKKAPELPEAPGDLTAPDDAEVTDSGLASKCLEKGNGEATPGPTDIVKTHFSGWTSKGEFLESTRLHDGPAQFKLDQVSIKGWVEGLQLMTQGEKRRLWIPAALAFGENAPEGAPQGDLVFDFELLEIQSAPKKPEPLPAPDDVAAAPDDAVFDVELFSIKKAPELPEAPGDLTAPDDAEVTDSGLASKCLEKGNGEATPGPTDIVKTHFSGWTSKGEFLESTRLHDGPAQFKLDQVSIKGWVEGLQLMTQGEKRRLWIPAALAFGENAPEGAPQGDLVFDFELLEIQSAPKKPEPLPAPDDVAAAPDDAEITSSGLASKILKKGSGRTHPKATEEVLVHYTGWTIDGEMFDSSVVRGEPISFPLNGVIPGWTEGVQLMVEGEKRRFWIPGKLAYGDTPTQPGAPSGMLVFEVELIKIG